jgi:hypothetical protein
MQMIDLYTPLRNSVVRGYHGYEVFETSDALRPVLELAKNWELDQSSIDAWFASPEGTMKRATAEDFLAVAPSVVEKVERIVGRELPGILVLMPSFGDFDGFARYELGEHRVMLGIDFPDADVDYLKALTAHELSHVFRDHSPAVWAHLGKPLAEITRKEYLEATDAEEHLVSEGLATLFSQHVFPEIPPGVHHYYDPSEWDWCVRNDERIDQALRDCLAADRDVWSFYGDSRVGRGSPSRLQYYWAAKRLAESLPEGDARTRALLEMHGRPALEFPQFHSSLSR